MANHHHYQHYYPQGLEPRPMGMEYGYQLPYNILSLGRNINAHQIDEYCYEENTPLHHAAFFGDLGNVQWLLEMGADLNAISYFRSPLLIACGSVENSYLGPRNSLLGADCFGRIPPRTPYYHQAIVKYLIEHGADIHVRDGANRSALDLSCESGNLEMVTLLLSLGAKLQRCGYSTLHHAVRGGNPAVVQLILDEGASVNNMCQYEGIAMQMAIERMWNHPNLYEIVRILLRARTEVNLTNPRTNETPLHVVCRNVANPLDLELLRLLLENNACINAECERGLTPLNYVFDKFLHPGNTFPLNEYELEKIEIILRHISEIRKGHMHDMYLSLKNDIILHDLYQQMKAELMLMNGPINELYKSSLLDVFTKDVDVMGRMLENKSVINDIMSSSIMEKLPFYSGFIYNKCLEIHSRRVLFVSACNIFFKYISCYQLPIEIVEKCCGLLSTIDLQSLVKVLDMYPCINRHIRAPIVHETLHPIGTRPVIGLADLVPFKAHVSPIISPSPIWVQPGYTFQILYWGIS